MLGSWLGTGVMLLSWLGAGVSAFTFGMARAALMGTSPVGLLLDGVDGFTPLLLLGRGGGFCLRGIGAFAAGFLGVGTAARGIRDGVGALLTGVTFS
tara:strand:- start:258 stop:548 length:291 start_codon:yes stop_codon:yes gene_type:complete